MAITVNKNSLQPQSSAPKKGSGFTNLQSVLQANKGNRLGETISTGVNQAIGSGKDTLIKAEDEFKTESAKNTVGTEQDKQTVKQGIEQVKAGSVDEQMANRFEQYRQGYQGPQGFSQQQQQNLGNQRQDVQDITKSIGNAQGQKGLLQRFVGQPQYSAGQQRLDSLLLGQSAAPQLRTARREGNQFLNQAQLAESNAANQGKTLKNQGEAFKQELRNQLTGTKQGLQDTVTGREVEKETASRNAMDVVQRALRGENISQQEFESAQGILGDSLNEETYGALGDIAKNNVNIFDPTKIDLETSAYASPEELASFNALKKLSGSDQQNVLGNFNLKQTDQKFDPAAFLDRDYLKQVSGNKKAEMESKTSELQKILRDQELVAQNVKGGAMDERTRQILSSNIGQLVGGSPVQGQVDQQLLAQINANGQGNFGGEDLDQVRQALSKQQAYGGTALSGNRDYLQGTNWMTGQTPQLSEGAQAALQSDLQKALAGVGQRRQEVAGSTADKLAQIRKNYGYDYGVTVNDPNTYQARNGESLKRLLQSRIK